MEKNIKILFAEDEQALGMIVSDSLVSRGFYVDFKTDGLSALEAFKANKYDILVFDIMMPVLDGFTLAREVRKTDKQIPIVFLTAKSQPRDVVKGFELGCNDYLKKPFSIEELIVRIKALTGRLMAKELQRIEQCRIGEYVFDVTRQMLMFKGDQRMLTYREAEILYMLYEHRNQVLERKLVLDKLWGDDSFFNARSMDVFITRLRKFLNKDSSVQIINVRGVGYKLLF